VNRQHKRNWQHAMRDGSARWGKMPPARRAASIVTVVTQVSLLVAALIDLRQRPAEQIRGNKRLWTLVVFINWVGPISYFLFGRLRPEKATNP
jgi:Phospholipase_D-nuclease N-terminal